MSYEVKKSQSFVSGSTAGRKQEYPFKTMDIGDVFDVPLHEAGRKGQETTPIMNAARYYRTYGGNPTFAVRCSSKVAPGFVRCERVK